MANCDEKCPLGGDESEKAPFNNFPVELFYQIFNQLTVSELKLCREVCSYWNSIVTDGHFFSKKICAVYKGGQLSLWEHMKRDFEILKGKSYIRGNYLRITSVLQFDFIYLDTWLTLSKLDHITSVELVKCYLIPNIVTILSRFKHLAELRLSDIYEFRISFEELEEEAIWSEYIFKSLSSDRIMKNLKILDIRIRYSWGSLECTTLIRKLAQTCSNLESLHLEFLDTGHPDIDQRGHYVTFFNAVCDFMDRNSETLKELTLITYDVEKSRTISHIISQNSDLPQEHCHFTFNTFLDRVEAHSWNSVAFNNMKKLNLRFRLAMLHRTRQFNTVFLPFIKKLENLNQFEISQVYSTVEDDFEKISRNLPENCRCEIEKLFNVRPSLELLRVPDLVNTELQRIRYRENLITPPDPLFPKDLAVDILGYYDSTVCLETKLVNWTILYAKWKSFDDIHFFRRNLNTLSKIKIQQSGVRKSEKLRIKDKDIRMICQSAHHLTHLELKFCNLLKMTDFGLTGISPTACERMWDTQNYTLEDEDLIAHSLLNLKYLRVIHLSNVGPKITDISAYHAFTGLTCLNTLGIKGHNMTLEGKRALSRLFHCNLD